jgi:hypothetical protein
VRFKRARELRKEESEEEMGFDDTVKNPEMKSFLKGIDLMNENEDGENKVLQIFVDLEEEKQQAEWSPLFYALTNIERLLTEATP